MQNDVLRSLREKLESVEARSEELAKTISVSAGSTGLSEGLCKGSCAQTDLAATCTERAARRGAGAASGVVLVGTGGYKSLAAAAHAVVPAFLVQAKERDLEDKVAALTSAQQRVEALEKENEDKARLLKGISQVRLDRKLQAKKALHRVMD